jgi:hypothetical protein
MILFLLKIRYMNGENVVRMSQQYSIKINIAELMRNGIFTRYCHMPPRWAAEDFHCKTAQMLNYDGIGNLHPADVREDCSELKRKARKRANLKTNKFIRRNRNSQMNTIH